MDFYFVHLSGLAKNQIFIPILYTKNPSNILGPKIFSLFLILYKFNPYFLCYSLQEKLLHIPHEKAMYAKHKINCILLNATHILFKTTKCYQAATKACHNYFKTEQKLFSTQSTHIISTIIHDYIWCFIYFIYSIRSAIGSYISKCFEDLLKTSSKSSVPLVSNYFLDQSQFEGNEHILAKVTRNIFVSESWLLRHKSLTIKADIWERILHTANRSINLSRGVTCFYVSQYPQQTLTQNLRAITNIKN